MIRPWKKARPDVTPTKSARPAELAAGRACARAALASLGSHGAPLPPFPDGSVAWPAGVVGSIAHTDGYCGAAVAWREDFVGIGLDIERLAGIPRDHWPLFCMSQEMEWLRGCPADEAEQLARILFSAKESCFKAASSLLAPLDPGEIHVELAMKAGGGTFTARLPSAARGLAIGGRVALTSGFIFAGALVPPA